MPDQRTPRVTAYLCAKGAADAIEFYKTAFDAVERYRMADDDVPDCDAAFQRAVDAGATVERPLKDEPYGRGGWIIDPFWTPLVDHDREPGLQPGRHEVAPSGADVRVTEEP